MKTNIVPVYAISQFFATADDNDVYANIFSDHIKHNRFTQSPHKHDFYMTVLFTNGMGKHEIDGVTYEVKAGCVFLTRPGSSHAWHFSPDIEGVVIFHTAGFFDLHFHTLKIRDFPFFSSAYNTPALQLKSKDIADISMQFTMILDEYLQRRMLRAHKIALQLAMLYTDLTRLYLGSKKRDYPGEAYIEKYRQLQSLIDARFANLKSPGEYASLLSVTEKHLNVVSKAAVNRTVSQLINDRVLLEAKRMLVNSGKNISEVAHALGFSEVSYFSRFFKKHTGASPRSFVLTFNTKISSGNKG